VPYWLQGSIHAARSDILLSTSRRPRSAGLVGLVVYSSLSDAQEARYPRLTKTGIDHTDGPTGPPQSLNSEHPIFALRQAALRLVSMPARTAISAVVERVGGQTSPVIPLTDRREAVNVTSNSTLIASETKPRCKRRETQRWTGSHPSPRRHSGIEDVSNIPPRAQQ
jgi:hypothetical protein